MKCLPPFILDQGRRPELIGGGLIRSDGGWSAVKAMRRARDHMKSDEQILGDGDFAQSVLDACKEQYEEGYRQQIRGYDQHRAFYRMRQTVLHRSWSDLNKRLILTNALVCIALSARTFPLFFTSPLPSRFMPQCRSI